VAKDDRDILQVLKVELDFLEHGGYRRSPRTAWRASLVFEDSPTCLNFVQPERPYRCEECALMQFVPAEHRREAYPCRHIPLNEDKETVDLLYRSGTQQELEDGLRKWLQTTIDRLEQEMTRSRQARAWGPPRYAQRESGMDTVRRSQGVP
jgi:hypothetical protein